MEAVASSTPVIVSNNETLMTYLQSVKTEHTFESGSANSLAKLLLKYDKQPGMINDYISEMPQSVTVEEYANRLMKTYEIMNT